MQSDLRVADLVEDDTTQEQDASDRRQGDRAGSPTTEAAGQVGIQRDDQQQGEEQHRDVEHHLDPAIPAERERFVHDVRRSPGSTSRDHGVAGPTSSRY